MTTEAPRRWRVAATGENHALPSDLTRGMVGVLLRRGIDNAEKLSFFMEPPHKLPHDPLRLAGMDLALPRLYRAVILGERVGIFGDFDVDGVTGAAIVAQGLGELGVSVIPYLPHRVEEGHGLSVDAISHLSEQGVSLIVTVDCGVTSLSEVDQARQLGVDVIITDHHTPQATAPAAVAIINPHMPDSSYPFADLCGAGLAFKLIQGLYQYLGQPWNRGLLELAALGTIADLVPLVDENRFLVREGLLELARTRRVGLQALYRRAGIQSEHLNGDTVSFQIAPRLNSPGRMGHALDSFKLLTTSSEAEAESLADKLEGLNQDRRDLTEAAFASAYEEVKSRQPLPPILLVQDSLITPGIAGLIAGRLAEAFHRPAVVMSAVDENHLVASGRSIPGFNLVDAFATCEDQFVRYGGHSQAAGFTVPLERLPAVAAGLLDYAGEALVSRDLAPELTIDAEIEIEELTPEFLQWLARLEPFGPANPQPVFLSRRVHVVDVRYLGRQGQHLRLSLWEGSQEWTAMAFNQADRWVGGVPYIDLVYSVTIDHWRGAERLTLKAADFRPTAG